MPYGNDQQGQQQGNYDQFAQQLAASDQTNRNYRARLVAWMSEIDDLAIRVEHDILMGRMDVEQVYNYAIVMMGLWRALRPQLTRKNNVTVLDEKEKDDFDYFKEYDGNVKKFIEAAEVPGEDGNVRMDYKNLDDLTKLHNILLLTMVKLDILSSNVGY
jgi:hypothetical protein